MIEAEFQAQVVELARLLGWRTLHVRRSIGRGQRWTTTTSIVGWPDLALLRPPDGLIFAELKVPPNKPTAEQAEVLAFLDQFPFAEVHVWTPDDLDDIATALRRAPAKET